MSVTYGVTSAGFIIKPFAEILAEINALFQSIFGNTIDLSPSEPFGQWAAIQATREWELWQLAQACYAARDPNSAEGAGLVEVASITGTVPVTPTQSQVDLTLCGTSAATIPLGSVVSVVGSGTQFETSVGINLSSVSAWVGSTTYSTVGEWVTNGGQVYQLTGAGTAAGSGGPTGSTFGSPISDGTATWTWVGTGTYLATVICYSVAFGPQLAPAGTLTSIATPVAGWSTAENLLDASPGIPTETDTQLRLRRIEELSLHGNARVDAIQAQLIALANAQGQALLTTANVFENDTDTTDAFGLPPHSVQAICLYPLAPVAAIDQQIVNTVGAAKAAGINTKGAQSGTFVDNQNVSHTINFDYPTSEWVWLKVTVIPGDNYAGDAAVQQALVTYSLGGFANFPGFGMGSNGTCYATALQAAVFENVEGVDECIITMAETAVSAGAPGSGAYSANPLTFTRTQLPVFDSSRITVSS